MKIVHINTYEGNGGAGRACLRLNNALKSQGTDSSVLVYYQFHKSEQSRSFSTSLFQKIRAVYHILAERYIAKFLTRSELKTPFSIQWFGSNIVNHPAVRSADVIHLHWINHGFLKPAHLAALEELNKPIVWTFHDSNAFTGGCHVRYACENFHKQCGNCPLLKMTGPKDLSHRNWLKKKKGYANLDFHIIAPSQWMADSVRFSSLMGVRQQTVIPNTIETAIFKPYLKADAKKIFKLRPEKFVILSGFMPSKNDKHKGTAYLLDALQILAKRPGIDPANIHLLIFGNKEGVVLPEFPFETTLLGTIQDDTQLAKCYSAADAFITPSLEDNLPNTVMESLACATPVIAFKTGGIPDMVQHLVNGYLADYQSAEDLATGMEWLYHEENAIDIQKEARLTILKYFSEEVVAQKHLQLYQSLLDSHLY